MSGPQHQVDNVRSGVQEPDFLDLIRVVSAFLTSNRDYRSVIPDVFEVLLKNLGCAAVLLFLRYGEGDNACLQLDFAESLSQLRLPGYRLQPNEGLNGRIAGSAAPWCSGPLQCGDLEGEERYNSYLEGKYLCAYPLLGEESLLGVLDFLFAEQPGTGMLALLAVVADILANYLKLVTLRREHERTRKKITILSGLKQVFSGIQELRPVLSVFMNQAASALSAEVGVFVLFRENSLEPELEINWGISCRVLQQLQDQDGKQFLSSILDENAPQAITRLSESFRITAGTGSEVVINSFLAGSLRFQQETRGALVFANKSASFLDSREQAFNEQDEELFGVMLDQLRNSVENYLLYKKIVSMKNFNENILHSIDSGIFSVDQKGSILSCNKRAEQISGFQGAMAGTPLHSVFPFPCFESEPFSRNIVSGTFPEPQMEYAFQRGEEERYLSFVVSSLKDERKKTIGAVVAVQDVTEQRIMERRVQRTEQLAALGELSAGLAHELKNPLTSMKGFAQLLPSRLEDREFLQKFSQVVSNEVMRLDDISERLLAFARPNVREFQAVDIPALIGDTILLVRYQIESSGVTYDFETVPDLPLVQGNPSQLAHVFLNVILNALQAMKRRNRLRIKVHCAPYGGTGRETVRSVICDFSDNGEGIAPENLDKVFNPFFTTKEKGTGLGLAISYRVIEEHGGLMEVESRRGRGTRVRIVLPAKEDAHG